MRLIIVESPVKGKTIEKFLGSEYKVLSSYGHIRDLPKSELGVDVENDFEPKYIIPIKAKKTVAALKKETDKARLTILATDEDREGEAIAYHLAHALKLKNPQRIVFHEITKQAIEEALKNPRSIDANLVDSQQTRRVLDRIVGYKLSPFLWKKVARGLSAGRVQSVAVRLITEREEEIRKFKPQEYWSIEALLQKIQNKSQISDSKSQTEFTALLIKKNEEILDKFAIKNKEEAEKIVKDLEGAEYKVIQVEKKEMKRNPLPPFTTSTLQQESWQRFRFPAKFTMRTAQQLYEQGLITYHRTDSLNLSELSLAAAGKFIVKNYGRNYHQFRKYKTKAKNAQEAHEAIRPTYADKTSESLKLEQNQSKLYDLIWRRFISSQMSQAIFDSTAIDISAKQPAAYRAENSGAGYVFRTTGQVLKFDGFLKIYPTKYKENDLPSIKTDEILELLKLIPSQHFTEPLPRYSEATLIKILEENGIGRPSTYAPIISTIQERNYVEQDENRKFRPTEIGEAVNNLLVNHFQNIVDIKFTANMEEDLDEIAEGGKKWVSVVREFYEPFEKQLAKKYQEVSKKDITEKPTEKTCPKCLNPLLIRLGKFGKFYACSKFPKCRYTESLEENTLGISCPKCHGGKIVEKRTRKRKIFYGCDQYPDCDFALWDKPTGEKCKKCGSLLVKTKRDRIKCPNKECAS